MDQAITRAAGATPSTITPAAAARRAWSILLTSANHGTVGPIGSTFPHAGEKHERVVVVEVPAAAGAPSDEVNLVLRAAPADFARAIEREVAAQAGQLAFPEQPTEAMLNAARDWSVKKYGQGIGNDAAIGCWKAMLAAAPSAQALAQQAPADFRDVTAVKRMSDQGLHLRFTSARACSEFERSAQASTSGERQEGGAA